MNKELLEQRCRALTLKIKEALGGTGNSITSLAALLSQANNKDVSVQSLAQKINRGLMPYIEAQEIAELLGYKIEWVKKQ